MKKLCFALLLSILTLMSIRAAFGAPVRIKELVEVQGVRENVLYGPRIHSLAFGVDLDQSGGKCCARELDLPWAGSARLQELGHGRDLGHGHPGRAVEGQPRLRRGGHEATVGHDDQHVQGRPQGQQRKARQVQIPEHGQEHQHARRDIQHGAGIADAIGQDRPEQQQLEGQAGEGEAEPELAGTFRIQSIPTLMAVRDKIVLYSQPGALPEDALEDIVSQIEALDMEAVHREIAENRVGVG